MGNKKIVPTWVSIIMLLLSAISIYGNISLMAGIKQYPMMQYRLLMIVDIVLFIASTILAVVYCLKGYKKNANKIFLAFSVVFTLAIFLQLVLRTLPRTEVLVPDVAMTDVTIETLADAPSGGSMSANTYVDSIVAVFSAIMFACMLVLTIAKDLGKRKSFILVAIIIISAFISAIAQMDNFWMLIRNVSTEIFITSIIFGIMIYAKYQDKAARGTK